jgi:hypothetical protein
VLADPDEAALNASATAAKLLRSCVLRSSRGMDAKGLRAVAVLAALGAGRGGVAAAAVKPLPAGKSDAAFIPAANCCQLPVSLRAMAVMKRAMSSYTPRVGQ